MARERYISFNTEELQRLGCADYEAIALYLALKQKVNFETGEFGTFRNQHIGYTDLAAELYRPGGAGVPERSHGPDDIKVLLDDLETLALLENRDDTDGRLTMVLTHSKKWPRKEAAAPARARATAKASKASAATPPAPTKPAARATGPLTAAQAAELDEMFAEWEQSPSGVAPQSSRAASSLPDLSRPSPVSSSIVPSVMISTVSNELTDGTSREHPTGNIEQAMTELDALFAIGEAVNHDGSDDESAPEDDAVTLLPDETDAWGDGDHATSDLPS